jgi:hypothetical protein
MGGVKGRQARHQPERRKRERCRDRERPAAPLLTHALRGRCNVAETHGDGLQDLLPGRREPHALARAIEESDTQMVFQQTDLAARGRLANPQFARRLGKAEMTGDRLEGNEGVGRGQSVP